MLVEVNDIYIDMTKTDTEGSFIEIQDCMAVLKKLRKRLLDLTNRNRLISYKHTKVSSLRVIDELPNQLAESLLSEQKGEMSFRAIPEPTEGDLIEKGYLSLNQQTGEVTKLKDPPTAEIWAKEKFNLDTSYEMPFPSTVNGTDDKHQDTNIQTLFYPNQMEIRLRNLYQKARRSIDETGLNILYLVFGFLEWRESHDSENRRKAPIYLIPVTLEKGRLDKESKTYKYTISYNGDDIIPNRSLMMKMKNDFGVALPAQNDEILPEEFFRQVEDAIKEKSGWKVRRFVTLGLLSFRKQVLEGDLVDDVCRSAIIDELLSGDGNNGHDGSFTDEYDIDLETDVHQEYPLIYDADSSQHSVIIDALSGKNLVVEGPPGTGKSQTITNLIAGAIAHGKRVLFVAEKLAALDVVKRRLDQANLGDFCLELHSHKAKKADVYGAIKDRLDNRGRYQNPRSIDLEIAGYEDQKQKLSEHVSAISKQWKNTELSTGDILNKATRYRLLFGDQLPPPAEIRTRIRGETFTPLNRRILREKISAIKEIENDVIEKLSTGTGLIDHPWFGVSNQDLLPYEAYRVAEILEDWIKALIKSQNSLDNLLQLLGAEDSDNVTPESVSTLVQELQAIPRLTGVEILPVVDALTKEELLDANQYLEKFHQLQNLYTKLSNDFGDSQLVEDEQAAQQLFDDFFALSGVFKNELPLDDLISFPKKITDLVDNLQTPGEMVAEILRVFNKEYTGTHEDLSLANQIIQAVSSLDRKCWDKRDERYDNDDLDDIIPELKNKLYALQEVSHDIEGLFNIDKLITSEQLEELRTTLDSGGLFRWFKSNWRESKRQLLSISSKPKIKLKTLRSKLDEAIKLNSEVRSINSNERYQNSLGSELQGLATDLVLIDSVRQWYKQVRKQFGSGFGPTVQIGSSIFTLNKSVMRAVAEQHATGLGDQLNIIEEQWSEISQLLTHDLLGKLNAPFTDNGAALLSLIHDAQKLEDYASDVFGDTTITLVEGTEQISKLSLFWDQAKEWRASSAQHALFGDTQLALGMDEDDSQRIAIELTLHFANHIYNNVQTSFVKDAAEQNLSKEWIDSLREQTDLVHRDSSQEREQFSRFNEKTELNLAQWLPKSSGFFELIQKNRTALEHVDDLPAWISYIQARGDLLEEGFGKIVELLESNDIDAEQFDAGCMYCVFTVLSEEILHESRDLARFSGQKQSTVQNRFIEYDKKIMDLQREKIAWRASQIPVPRGKTTIRKKDLTDLAMIEHQCSLSRRHAPIRKLIHNAGDALTALMPCLMMSPMSAAHYIKHGENKFDLLIMDEASQIRPEDAFGVISKVGQVVVVGDQKQLPPTNFFNANVADDDEGAEEELVVDGPESILEMSSTRFTSRRLRWHYRSQHESLVSFSNARFYNDDLVIFPSPHEQSDEYGIQFERVKRGAFVNQRNLEEVKVIVAAVKAHVLHSPEESLGIVAMNVTQRDAIESALETASKEDPQFALSLQKIATDEKSEPIFVKNLETVQGDERDIIYISMTYGPQEPGGNTYQRFGPINSELGWRRLNVLFTRSRKRMHIFSSMGVDDIRVSANSMRGVKELRNFLSFCETGLISHTEGATGRPPDSDFEIAVMRELEKHGYECKAQIGVSGFFIDLAVVDPHKPTRFLMGVECDGATYHSAKSARDRDRLRQEILERLGWRIRRIWSTDWFMNPQAELRPILEELNRLKTASKQEQIELSETEIIDEIIEQADEEEKLISSLTQPGMTLYQKLKKFNNEVIMKEFPNTDQYKRLLRPSMIEALVSFQPYDREEFLEMIPGFLRDGTDSNEGKYLSEVFSIIDSSRL